MAGHAHDVARPLVTYDLLLSSDGMVQATTLGRCPHERVSGSFNIGQPGVGALSFDLARFSGPGRSGRGSLAAKAGTPGAGVTRWRSSRRRTPNSLAGLTRIKQASDPMAFGG